MHSNNQYQKLDQGLLLQDNNTGVHTAHCANGRVSFYSRCNPLGEKSNQDSILLYNINEDVTLFAIADGVGGSPLGDKASKLALESIREALSQYCKKGGDLRGEILNGIEAGNQAVQALNVGAATTLVVALMQGESVQVFHIGDSEALLISGQGNVKFATIPHTPTGMAVEAGMMKRADAADHPEHHLVLNSLGSSDMRLDVGPKISLNPHDRLLMGSDGLFDNLAINKIVEEARKGDLESSVAALKNAAELNMTNDNHSLSKPDDITLLLFGFDR